MQRRTALMAAGSVSLAVVTASLGIAVNLGILQSGTTGVGDLAYASKESPAQDSAGSGRAQRASEATTTTAAAEVLTYFEDVVDPAAPAGPSVEPPTTIPAGTGGAPPAVGAAPGEDAGGNQPGTGNDGGGDGNAPPETAPTTAPPAPATTAPPVTRTYDAGGAGTVTAQVAQDTLRVVATSPASGWTASVAVSSGHEVLVEFTGPGGKVLWKAQVENGQVSAEIETEGGDD